MKLLKKPLLVGERTNITGSAEFRRLILEEKFDDATKIGERQIEDGAGALDICFISSKDEKKMMGIFIRTAIKKINAPFIIDSLSADVIEEALQIVPQKCIINSINLGCSEEKLKRVTEMALTYKATVVVSAIDSPPHGKMALKRGEKLEKAKCSIEVFSHTYKLDPSELIYDPLLFPVLTKRTGCKNPAEETIEGLRLIKEHLPGLKVLLGLSNISFGLPAHARSVLNSVFLYHSTKAGLDVAIADPANLSPYESIDSSLRSLAENLIFLKGENPLEVFLKSAAQVRG